MSTSKISNLQAGLIPEGAWTLERDASELAFSGRGSWGLMNVKGTFGTYDGSLTVKGAEARGRLVIAAASIDTTNKKRDDHLRSKDFFEVERYEHVTFELTAVTGTAGAVAEVSGILQVKDTRLEITAPLNVRVLSPNRVQLATELEVERSAAGLTYNKMGVMRGPVHLRANIVLARVD